MKKIKFAVIGCGNIALRNGIPALIKAEYTEPVVCIDHKEYKSELIKKEFNLPFESSLEKALLKYDFDAVYISTPIGTHKQYCIEAANAKKHILCEKSLATSVSEVEDIVSTCKINNVAILEGFMYQFHTQHQYVRNLINENEIGRIIHFQAWFGFPPLPENNFRYSKKLGGGALLDAGSYTVHSARKMFMKEPVRMFYTSDNEGHDVDIRGTISLDFGMGQTAHLVFGFNYMYQNQYMIWGEKGILRLERAFSIPADFSSELLLIKQGSHKKIMMEPHNHFIEQFNHFAKNINNKLVVESWMSDALNQAKVLHSRL